MDDDTHSIVFGPTVGEFEDVLRVLCDRSTAVTLTLRDETSFGAVLGSAEGGVLIYDGLDGTTGLPSGDAGTVGIGDVARSGFTEGISLGPRERYMAVLSVGAVAQIGTGKAFELARLARDPSCSPQRVGDYTGTTDREELR